MKIHDNFSIASCNVSFHFIYRIISDRRNTRHVPAEVRDGKLILRLLMDKESIELFINDGERVVTSLIPASPEADGITFAADAPVTLSVEAHHLK